MRRKCRPGLRKNSVRMTDEAPGFGTKGVERPNRGEGPLRR
jgi:hypothetical protein